MTDHEFWQQTYHKEESSNWAGAMLMWDAIWVVKVLFTFDLGGVLTAIIFSIPAKWEATGLSLLNGVVPFLAAIFVGRHACRNR